MQRIALASSWQPIRSFWTIKGAIGWVVVRGVGRAFCHPTSGPSIPPDEPAARYTAWKSALNEVRRLLEEHLVRHKTQRAQLVPQRGTMQLQDFAGLGLMAVRLAED